MRSWILPALLLCPAVALADADGDGFDAPADCDDGDSAIHPGAVEVTANGVDENCDGSEDCYVDLDGDHWGRAAVVRSTVIGCVGVGVANIATDCDDNNSAVHPVAVEILANGVDENCDGKEDCYLDQDGDHWGGNTVVPSAVISCVGPGVATGSSDCDDHESAIYPGAAELCDDIDNDCNGVTDDDERRWYTDRDFDGFGDDDEWFDLCAGGSLPPLGAGGQWVITSGDCDSTDPGVSPGRAEFCDGVDNDCDGQIDNGLAADTIWHVDRDHDGFGRVSSNGAVQGACPPNLDYTSWSPLPTDCDDTDETVHPLITVDDWDHPPLWGSDEESSEQDRDPAYVGDGIDQDCDAVDLCFVDRDDDKFGQVGMDGQLPWVIADNNLSCRDRSQIYTADNALDCDDTDRSIGPGDADLVGDGIDQDCDGHDLCFVDEDQDGWGTAEAVPATGSVCGEAGDATTDRTGDCDDSAGTGPDVQPGRQEVCDGLDNNCNGEIDEVSSPDATVWYLDADGDGWGDVRDQIKACGQPVGYVAEAGDCNDSDPSTFPLNEEVCDGIDNNCLSGIDEQDVCATTTQQPTSGGGCHAPWGGAYAMLPILLPMSWFRRRETKRRA